MKIFLLILELFESGSIYFKSLLLLVIYEIWKDIFSYINVKIFNNLRSF